MFLVDKIRPGRRSRFHVEEQGDGYIIQGLELDDNREQAPHFAATESRGGGYFETAAGLYDAPPGVHEAPHSVWPAVIAASVALALFGLVTSYAFSLFGLVVFIVGVGGWVSELLDE